jgi:hypothetical protein
VGQFDRLFDRLGAPRGIGTDTDEGSDQERVHDSVPPTLSGSFTFGAIAPAFVSPLLDIDVPCFGLGFGFGFGFGFWFGFWMTFHMHRCLLSGVFDFFSVGLFSKDHNQKVPVSHYPFQQLVRYTQSHQCTAEGILVPYVGCFLGSFVRIAQFEDQFGGILCPYVSGPCWPGAF